MKKLNSQQLEFLNETVNHYNKNNRSATLINETFGENKCSYFPQNNKSLGCAIGRHVSDKDLCKEWDKLPNDKSSVYAIFEQLPEYLRLLDCNFLLAIQRLHDNPNNWDENGLSETGRYNAKEIEQGNF